MKIAKIRVDSTRHRHECARIIPSACQTAGCRRKSLVDFPERVVDRHCQALVRLHNPRVNTDLCTIRGAHCANECRFVVQEYTMRITRQTNSTETISRVELVARITHLRLTHLQILARYLRFPKFRRFQSSTRREVTGSIDNTALGLVVVVVCP